VYPSRLAFCDDTMRFVTEPGAFRFSVGGASDDAEVQATVDLTGTVAEVRPREIVATLVSRLA
jgi:beta-glucosidase